MNKLINALFGFAAYAAILYLTFLPVRKNADHRVSPAEAFILAAHFMVYWDALLGLSYLVQGIRIFLGFAYILVVGHRRYDLCLYFSLVFNGVVSGVRAIKPLADFIIRQLIPRASPLAFSTGGMIALTAVKFVILFFTMKRVQFNRITNVRPLQWIVVLVLTFLITYGKQVCNSYLMEEYKYNVAQTFWYSMIIIALSILILLNFDRFFLLEEDQKEKQLIELSQRYQYNSLKLQLQAQDEIHKLHHDMKNHLITLEHLSNDFQKEYISELVHRMESVRRQIETGNETLDGLLEEKFKTLQNSSASITVDMDLSDVSVLSPVDICTIFGNAIDNAVEAICKMPKDSAPFIRIKSDFYAGQLVIRISNSYQNELLKDTGGMKLLSTKRAPGQHGIGISSMRSAVERYHGSVTYTAENHVFSLYILIPIQ